MPLGGRASAGNLPYELTSFVGRRREIAEVRRLLSVSRLVTLTGVGGVGKTRLALRVAADSSRVFDDGVWLVGLGELPDPDAVVDAVLSALNVREGRGGPPQALLVEYLTARKVLLVLDNCEHLVDQVANLAIALLRACPELRILATSREPLGIGGEAVLRVPPLTMPEPDQRSTAGGGLGHYEAVNLFAERAASLVPGFAVTEDNQDVVAAICRRLDGLPLAIELAAVRLRAMSVEQLLQRLTNRFGLLTSGSRGAPARQQTLQWCIDWSHELCTPAERELWGRLAVFSGSFELDAVEGICTDPVAAEQVVDLVGSLIDKSILIRDVDATGAVRYRMLETLRDYGTERLQETGEFGSLLRRHRDWYEQVVLRAESDWVSSRQVAWIVRLDAEQPNILAALQFCLIGPSEADAGVRMAAALYPYWRVRGRLREGMRWLAQLLAVQDGAPSVERIRALYVLSVLSGLHGDPEASALYAERGGAVAERLGDRTAAALMDDATGHHALITGDYATACECFESSIAVFRQDGNLLYLIWSLLGLATASDAAGNRTRSEECRREVVALTESRGESVYRGWALWGLGVASWERGEHSPAKKLIAQVLQLARSGDDRISFGGCLEVLSWIAVEEGAPRRAATLMGAAEALAETVGVPSTMYPNLTAVHERVEQTARRAIGDRAFEVEFRRGIGMRFEDAAAYALDENDRVGVSAGSDPSSLTRRELQVAELVAEGLTNKAIADRLVISQRTAQGHVEHILAKLGFTSRTQIAAWIIEQRQGRQS
ncbi:ATP-binding protein [Rhodococcus wratislaviensis]|uniref:Putative LuxR family transcriptional regulator n=1 Tax=Rhodococcus wratislaviensis NBRC 100605 TaxID=1219028 RepID=X0QWB9_RHOWR|nr:LuxR C-terminal-related transcriptional regulator [Rhodococcus wratislaviensis]GAF42905.1 putative LuxR family transcriptional regulator [Rhodococcus wratislaviensis NBRC 100605]